MILPTMIAFVRQENSHFCFLACVQSFLAENGKLVSQRELLTRGGSWLGTNPDDLGAFAGENFDKIEEAFGIKATLSHSGDTINAPTQSFFAHCHWENDPARPHWVRLLWHDQQFLYAMNPGHDICPQEIVRAEFRLWWKKVYKIQYTHALPGSTQGGAK